RDGLKAIFVLVKHRIPSSRRLAAHVAMTAAILVAAFGIGRGTWAVGGSDSSCYALMANAFARGDVQPYTDLALEAPWPDAARTFAPAGFIPSPVRAGAASPVCAPGFSLLLAAFQWVAGAEGMFLATPLAGALLIWLTFVFGRQIAGPGAGAAAAVIVAATPIVLFQVTQPMNDVAGAVLWMAVLVAASSPEPTRAWLLGLFTGLAILVRPNLAPAGAIVGLWMVVTTWMEKGGVGTVRRRATAFALAVAPSIGMVLALNALLYGDPLESGYGSIRDLFSVQHIVPNLRHYGSAIVETELGLPLFGVAALATASPSLRPIAWLAVSVAVSIVAVYVLYRPFPEWWYLRFLLPALVPLTALAVAAAAHLVASRAQSMVARVLVAAAVAGIAAFGVVTAHNRQAFDLQRLEARFRRSGEIVRTRLPADAVFVTVWHSGSVRFHADRPAVLWDSLDPSATDRAISWLSSRGFEPYLLLERWEEALFRERFGSRTELGDLDWPPRFDIDRQVRIFKPSDRTAYTQGQSIPTEHVVPRR
ncbi:MAG: hypothetical protein ACRD1H_06000, partial [Vicinamibacterales bacterium]